MARPRSAVLTEREAQIMDVLWEGGPATAEAIRQALSDEPHDSTVRTLLRVLARKGYVRARGRQPAVYEAKIARSQAQGKAAQNLLARFFDGSAEALVTRLVDDQELTLEELERIRRALARRKKKGGRS